MTICINNSTSCINRMFERCDNVALETQINNVVTMQVQLSEIGVRQNHKNKSDVLLTLCAVKTQKKEVV